MSKINPQTISLSALFDEIEKETCILPNVQRDFEWKENDIISFLDSLMRDYPTGTCTFWRTSNKLLGKPFLKDFNKGKTDSSLYKQYKSKKRYIVLDGQQRIQSLYTSFRGKYKGKDLYFNFLSDKYGKKFSRKNIELIFDFGFQKEGFSKKGYIKVKDMIKILTKEKEELKKRNSIKKSIKWDEIKQNDKERLFEDNFSDFKKLANLNIHFLQFEDDSEDNEEKILEIFIRINNQGKKLTFASLIYSHMKNNWPQVDKEFKSLVKNVKDIGFSVDSPFLIKTCLSLINLGCEFNLYKIKSENINIIKDNWLDISNSIINTFEFLVRELKIRSSYLLPSNLSIIPIIYTVYKNKVEKHTNICTRNEFIYNSKIYLYTSLLKGKFSSKPEEIVDKSISIIDTYNYSLDSELILKKINISEIKILKSDIQNLRNNAYIKLILNLIYFHEPTFLDRRISNDWKLDVDHIFPGGDCKNYYSDLNEYFTIENYCYLSAVTNRSKKSKNPPLGFFKNANELNDINRLTLIDKEKYDVFHCIRKDILFDYTDENEIKFRKNFEKFKKTRINLILKRINSNLLSK